MGAFIARQPNGLLCRFSTVVDTITDFNMTDDEFIELMAENGREQAREILKHYLKPYEHVKQYFIPNNMTQETFDELCKKMEE